MLHDTPYIRRLVSAYPADAAEALLRVEQRLDSDPVFAAKFDTLVHNYMVAAAIPLDVSLDALKTLAEEYEINVYTLHFVYIMNCTEILRARYAEQGIDEAVFWQGVDDLRCKLLECIEVKGVPGTFVAGWNNGFLKMTRFAYGRFQFEWSTYDRDFGFVMPSGRVVKKGDRYVNFHIPSSGVPLTDDVRIASYKEAYAHYKDAFGGQPVLFGCGSWLLYPRHREFLPPALNILRFMDDFEIVDWEEEKDGFHNDWRVFGRHTGTPWKDMPRDTSLRRAYADWLTAGNHAGHAFGLFEFDGERIVRAKGAQGAQE